LPASNIDHGGGSPLQCLSGVVFIRASNVIGATNGVLFTNGISIPIRQVPGPSLRGPALSSVGQQFATLCGTFIPDRNQAVFNVQVVIPRGGAGSGDVGSPGI
jgi:hypothetical protein